VKKLALILFITTTAFADSALINAFNSGELSPLLEGRTDIKRYYSGCRTLENMLVMAQGGATKRPGTYYIADAKYRHAACRLIPFEYSTTQAYIIEAGNLYARFYMDGGQILQDDDSVYELTTTYTTEDLFELQYVQSADKMYIAHNDYPPRELTRTDHNAWTITDFAFENGPFLPENTTTTTITPNSVTGTIDLVASQDVWNANHVGALWRLTHTSDANEITGSLAAADACSSTLGVEYAYPPTGIIGVTSWGNYTFGMSFGAGGISTVQAGRAFEFCTHGKWTGTVLLQRSYDSGTIWHDVTSFSSREDGNISYADTESVADAIYRIKMNSYTSGTCYYSLVVRSFDIQGIVEIADYVDACNVQATVISTLGGTDATKYWAEGAWSDDEGYPACVAFYEERLCFAATKNKPDTIWMSVTGDWPNFKAGALDTDAVTFTLSSDTVNAIRWMVPQAALLVGTTGGEWKLSPSAVDDFLSANNPPRTRKQSSYGSAQIQALAMNNQVIFAQRQAQKVRKLEYSFEQDNWIADDLTLLAEHITGNGITSMALQKNPYPILWVTRADGTLSSLTLEDSHEVIGWARHITSTDAGESDFESVAVIPGPNEDEVWVSVYRDIADNDERYIEQFAPQDWGSDQNDIYFVDCGTTNAGSYDVVGPTSGVHQIYTPQDLQDMQDNLTWKYELMNDLDMTGFTWTPVGGPISGQTPFTGTFDGRGFTISNLEIYGTTNNTTGRTLGVFGEVEGDGTGDAGVVKNVHLENVYVKAGQSTSQQLCGTLCSYATQAIIENCSATGRIEGATNDGALYQKTAAGGLCYVIQTTSDVNNCWADVDIMVYKNAGSVGGFVGNTPVYTTEIRDCYAHGDILEGPNYNAAYQDGVGGFVGNGIGTFYRCYSTGYIPEGYRTSTFINCGGFIGDDLGISANTEDCFYDADTSNCGALGDEAENNGKEVTGLSTAEAMLEATYTNWDFNDVWQMSTYPELIPYVDEDVNPRVTSITWDGLDHLEGETVDVVTDGAYYGSQTVVAGTITLDSTDYNNITQGLPYTGKLEPMKLEVVGKPGALFGEIKRITHLFMRFYKTVGCDAGPSFTDYDPMIFNNDPNNAVVYSGDIDFEFDGDNDREGDICLAEDEPYPLTILALKAIYKASEN
jgi:hypothetical protein